MNPEHLKIFNLGIKEFNTWRLRNPNITMDLSGMNFAEMNLDEINFSGVLLHDSTFSGASLIGADFSQSNISNCIFNNADARLAKFDGAVASKARFINTNLSKAYMRVGFFDYADFTGADLSKTSFRHSSLNGAVLKKTKANKAGFFGVNLFKAKTGEGALGGAHLPKDYRVHRTGKQMTKIAVWMVNLVIIIGLIIVVSQFYSKSTKKYGSPGVVIGAFMDFATGNLYASQGKYKEAIGYYKNAVKKKPDEAIYHYKLSYAYMLAGDNTRAEECYRRYEKLKPAKLKQSQEIDAWMKERKKNQYK